MNKHRKESFDKHLDMIKQLSHEPWMESKVDLKYSRNKHGVYNGYDVVIKMRITNPKKKKIHG